MLARRPPVFAVCLFALFLGIAGCSGGSEDGSNRAGNNGGADASDADAQDGDHDDSDDADTATSDLTAGQMETRYLDILAEALCSAVYECPQKQSPQNVAFLSRYGDKSTCVENVIGDFGVGVESDLTGNLERGLAEFHPASGEACLEALREWSRDDRCASPLDGLPEPDACEEAFTGTQMDGEPCESDEQCESGYCDRGAETGDACWDGLCGESPPENVGAAGESCSGSRAICDPGEDLVCDLSADGQELVCVEAESRGEGGTCRSSRVCSGELGCLGQTCQTLSYAARGETCDRQTEYCEPGLVCSFDVEGQGTCAPPGQQGDGCLQTFSCGADFYCSGADPGTSLGSCEPRQPEGESCRLDFDCQSDLRCTSSGECAPPEPPETCEIL